MDVLPFAFWCACIRWQMEMICILIPQAREKCTLTLTNIRIHKLREKHLMHIRVTLGLQGLKAFTEKNGILTSYLVATYS